jgi:hypothetical protein
LESEQEQDQNKLIGREWLLSELTEWYQSGGRHACLSAPPGAGKSRVLRAFAETVPGTVILDFSHGSYGLDWPPQLSPAALGGRPPTLLILDSIELSPPVVWRSRRLAHDFPGVPILFAYRPGVHHESLQTPGTWQFEINPRDPRHQKDLREYMETSDLGHLADRISTFREADFLVRNPKQGLMQLASYYIALWRETTRPHAGNQRVLMEQLALLLADTPEPLPFGALSDFTGIPSVQILEAVDYLSPILVNDNGRLAIFSPGMSASLRSTFSRDMGAVHGRIVSYFRDTFESWQEMHDQYGWRYLVLHCDRLARSSRKQDFSVLHWLNEGSFSQLKLERTGMLPSVLKDLRLSLLASLETDDLSRIISFGCRIAQLRKQESIKTVHRLADAGHLDLAQENGRLITGEPQRFLVWLLYGTQTLEASQWDETLRFLLEADELAKVDLGDLDVELAAGLLGGMLSTPGLPDELRTQIETILAMDGLVNHGCLSWKTVAKNHHLPAEDRARYLQNAMKLAKKLDAGKSRDKLIRELESRLARISDKASKKKAFPTFLLDAKDPKKEFQKRLKSVKSNKVPLATLAAALIPVSDQGWLDEAFESLFELVGEADDIEVVKHSLGGLIQSLEDSTPKELSTSLLDGLSGQILALEDPELKSRFLGRFAVLLSFKGRPLESSQRVSLAAATAFAVTESEGRADALLSLAAKVATTGPISRSRDLAFHALELRARLRDLDLESKQLVRLLSSASAGDNQSAEEIVRLGSSLRFDDSPAELEAKGRAMVVLAAGLSRLGSKHHAKLYRSKAAEAVRSIDELDLRVHLLADLAAAFHSSGEEKEARRLIKEARGLFDEQEEARGLLAATALLKVYMVVENKTQTRKMFQTARKFLEERDHCEWLSSVAFLDLLYLAQRMDRVDHLLPVLKTARESEKLSDEDRLGVLRTEIRLQNFQKAEEHAAKIEDLSVRCRALIDLSLSLLTEDHIRALEHLTRIPLENYRCEGIRRLALLNSSDIRPTQQARVRDVLCRLTLMAAEHPDAMDAVLSRWIQACPDRETIIAIADKLNWPTGAGSMFRSAMEAMPHRHQMMAEQEAAEELLLEPEPEPEEPEDEGEESDDGFQAVSLTNMT